LRPIFFAQEGRG